MGYSKSSSKREVYNNTILPKKQEKSPIDNLTLQLKQLEKKEEEEQQQQQKLGEGKKP